MVSKVEVIGGCWLWTGSLNAKGYPLWYPSRKLRHILENKTTRAHRIAYQLLIGPIPSGLQLDHVCAVKRCINPLHMEPCTNHENQIRKAVSAGHNTAGRLL